MRPFNDTRVLMLKLGIIVPKQCSLCLRSVATLMICSQLVMITHVVLAYHFILKVFSRNHSLRLVFSVEQEKFEHKFDGS